MVGWSRVCGLVEVAGRALLRLGVRSRLRGWNNAEGREAVHFARDSRAWLSESGLGKGLLTLTVVEILAQHPSCFYHLHTQVHPADTPLSPLLGHAPGR